MKKKVLFIVSSLIIILCLIIQLVRCYLDQMINISISGNPIYSLFHPFETLEMNRFFQYGYNQRSILYLFSLYLKNPYVLLLILFLIFLSFVCLKYLLKENRTKIEHDHYLIQSIKNRDVNNSDPILEEVQILENQYRNRIIFMSMDTQKQNEEYENVAHQIKSSLSTIMLNTDLIDGNDEKKNIIIDQIDRTNELLNKFLSGHDVRNKYCNYNFEVSNLRNCVYRSIQNVKTFASEKHIKISYELEDCFLSFDHIWIEEAIETILKNAMSSANENTIVTVKLEKKELNALIYIQDIGKSIDINGDNIFERYTTTKSDGEHFGIGLHMVKTIIENHFGTIELISRDDGAKFVITLPIIKLEEIESSINL